MTEQMPSVISIDPKTAVDLDDAIGVRIEGEHLIADICLPDVPAFVTPGGSLDAQALERGMTIYRTNRIKQPMLSPEVNGHLTLSSTSTQMMVWVELRYSHSMELLETNLKRIRHRTDAQMSYEEADNILTAVDHPFHKRITELSIFARALHSRRQTRTGALFDITAGIYTGEDGSVQTLAEQDRYLSHLVVMEFMIAANSALAELAHRTGAGIIYRNHKPESVGNGERNAIKAELEQIHGMEPQEAQAHIRHIASRVGAATLGTVSQGHWGLDTPHYAWFTSPLRRCPDIINLRALLEDYQDPDLEAKAVHLTDLFQTSGREQRTSMKFSAYRRIFNTYKFNGVAAIDDINLRTAINALDHAGKADERITLNLVRHRLETGNYTIPHLVDLLVNQVGVTREDTLGLAVQTLLEPASIGHAMNFMVKQSIIEEVLVQDDGRAAAATMLKNLLEQRHRPVPACLVKKASTEKVVGPAPNEEEAMAAMKTLYDDDAPLNSKSKLLEVAAKQKATVDYSLIGRTGPDHEPVFEVEVSWRLGKTKLKKRNTGRSLTLAERYVSRDMLIELAATEDTIEVSIDPDKHPKSSLLEHAALNRGKLSVGKVQISGLAHQPQFDLKVQYSCKIGSFSATGSAGSKKEAERRACQRIVNDIIAQSTALEQKVQANLAAS